jgi:hypothetical protein
MCPTVHHPTTVEDAISSLTEMAKGVLWMTAILEDHNKHPLDTKMAAILIGNKAKVLVLNFTHDEGSRLDQPTICRILSGLPKTKVKLMADNGKTMIHLLKPLGVHVDHMADAMEYIKRGEPIESTTTEAHRYFYRLYSSGSKINMVIPLVKHVEIFRNWIEKQEEPSAIDFKDAGYLSLVRDIIPTLARLEEGGMFVNKTEFTKVFPNSKPFINQNDLFRCNYNPWSSTGRPSNTFGSVNLAALNKDNDERVHFVSRFGNRGILLLADFKSYHPHLLARLANYQLNAAGKADTYRWIASQILGKDDITKDELSAVKGLTFQNLYGRIDKDLLEVPYFAAIQKYIDGRWKFYNEHGYVETPVFNRAIKECHFGEKPFPNKVVNYLLQAYETERNLVVLNNVLDHLENKKSKIVLYLYDSILIDFCMEDGPDLLFDIKRLMEEGEYPVSIKTGADFKNMNNFVIPE